MSEPPSEAAKWACEYCTYENFPSSIKCTMCRGPKPFLNKDIFSLRVDEEQQQRSLSNTNLAGLAAAGACDNKVYITTTASATLFGNHALVSCTVVKME